METSDKLKILIADDSEFNRDMLSSVLEDGYDIIEAENGSQAIDIISSMGDSISLVLLDIRMPGMDGYEVLAYMNSSKYIERIPVIMISSEASSDSIQRAYDLGASDYVERPFNIAIVRKRVSSTILLFSKQKKMMNIIVEQMYEKEKNNKLMISILSHIVEFRNKESGLHVTNINIITDMLLRKLSMVTDKYKLTNEMISTIVMASSLHDIGKIIIPEEILNKPGRFTPEEFAIMKTHSMAGAEMIKDLSRNFNEPLLDTIYDICRWHHERFDGRGYPDGLVGDNIPISAQVVSIADAYDALTSERCYKKAFSHKEAIRMIKDGECGMFNPVLVKCLISIGDNLVRELSAKAYTPYGYNGADIINVTQKLSHYGLAYSESNLNQQKYEYNRVRYISDNSSDIFIDYNSELSLLSVNKHGVEEIHIPGTVHDPLNSKDLKSMIDMMSVEKIRSMLDKNDPNNVDFDTDICFNTGERPLHYKCFCHAVWIWSDSPKYLGLICKLMPEQNDS